MNRTSGFVALQRFILNELAQHLSPALTYHGLHHTKDVLAVCKQYARRYNIRGREVELLKTGALVHDLGFVHTYHDHEEKGVTMIQEILPHFDYSVQEINTIAGLIMATKVPQQPQNVIEQILCDADLDYLGRADFDIISESLFQELKHFKIIEDCLTWDKMQVKFLESHQYHTNYAQKYRQPNKAMQLEVIKKRLKNSLYHP